MWQGIPQKNIFDKEKKRTNKKTNRITQGLKFDNSLKWEMVEKDHFLIPFCHHQLEVKGPTTTRAVIGFLMADGVCCMIGNPDAIVTSMEEIILPTFK